MLKKLLLKTLFSVSMVLSIANSANAALITQDIISDTDGVIGFVTINTSSAAPSGEAWTFEAFNFFGFDLAPLDPPDDNQFLALFDVNDLFAGIRFLQFDLNDIYGAYAWNGAIDADFGFGLVDVFTDAGGIAYFADDVRFGEATVVPEPAAIALFLTALLGLRIRRKQV